MVIMVIHKKADQVMGFTVHGHADYGAHGQDIVCAGVSALTQTVVLGLVEHAKLQPDLLIEPGNMRCMLTFDQARAPSVQLLLKTLVSGLREMERKYGEYIEIHFLQEGGS